MVVRRDVALEAIGTMAQLPPDHTPLQIGATGVHRGRSFRLLGRLRMSWGEGSWNEWHAEFDGGTQGWIAEAQGFFVVSTAVPFPAGIDPRSGAFRAGAAVVIHDAPYTITDIKAVRVIAGEGELPFVAQPGEKWQSAELSGGGTAFAGIEWDGTEARAYAGHFAQPGEISWQGLRAVPGWNGEPLTTERRQSEALNCPACAGVIGLHAPGQTMSIRCTHCGTIVDTSQPQPEIVQKVAKAAKQPPPLLPLGKRGLLKGVEWLALGHIRRKDQYSTWSEYLLYNPWAGFAWLTEWKGHWNFVTRALVRPVDGGSNTVVAEGRPYRLFAREQTTVQHVDGEFYWRITVGEHCLMEDYVAPPHIASCETYPSLNEVTWSLGEYISGQEVARAFQLPKLPLPQGPFLNAPNPHQVRWRSLKRLALLALAAALVLQMAFGLGSCWRRDVFAGKYTFERATTAAAFVPGPANASGFPSTAAPAAPAAAEPAPIVTPAFELKGRQSPVRLAINAPVSNSWLGFDALLVNETTGQKFPADITVEYYHGSDSDGPWKEGGQKASADIPAVPPGLYHLELRGGADAGITSMPFDLRVQRGGLFLSNFIIVLIGLIAYPLNTLNKKFKFEHQRWQQSDFSP